MAFLTGIRGWLRPDGPEAIRRVSFVANDKIDRKLGWRAAVVTGDLDTVYSVTSTGAAAGAVFFALLTGDFRFAAFATGAFAAALLPAAFLAGAAPSARFSAHRRFVASLMALRPAADILRRFGLTGSGVEADAGSSPLSLAHLAFCAKAIFWRAAALNRFRLGAAVSGVVAVSVEPPWSMALSSAIWASICTFCCSNPAIAALIISGVSCRGM